MVRKPSMTCGLSWWHSGGQQVISQLALVEAAQNGDVGRECRELSKTRCLLGSDFDTKTALMAAVRWWGTYDPNIFRPPRAGSPALTEATEEAHRPSKFSRTNTL